MDKFSKNEEFPPSYIQETLKLTSNDGDNDEPPKKKAMKLDCQVDNGAGDDTPVETVTLESTTETGQVVPLPPELLTMILTNLDKNNDLLVCRQVNSTWKALISPILRQREIIKIYLDGTGSFRTENKIPDLVQLNGCLENGKKLFNSSDSFPGTRFGFSDLSLEEDNVQTFFDLHGPFVQSLKLHLVQVSVEDGQLKSLSRLLTQQASNIRHIDLKLCNIYSKKIPTILFDHKQTKLPHLQTLGQDTLWTEFDKFILKEIMGAADNLKVYNLEYGFQNLDQLDLFLSTGKIQTLQTMEMKITEDIKMELWEKLAEVQPTLASLKIIYRSGRDSQLLKHVSAVINKILQSSKDTLTTFDLLNQCDPIPGLHFPMLTKLKQLKISRHFATIFPRGQSRLSTIFPKVSKVALNMSGATSVFWDSFMENNLPSVHTLKVYNIENPQDLSRLFPNLKNLLVICPKLDVVGGIFEHMKGLESLELSFLNCCLHQNQFPALDSALTGFSPATCIRLAEAEEMLEDGEVEKLRENPSILELTGLRILKIANLDGITSRVLSRVSGIWAFQKMPQVKVTVTAVGSVDENMPEAQAALDVIAPFVHSVGFADFWN